MSRYIDADALDKRIYNDIPISVFGSIKKMAAVREIIAEQPTVDAVPVVRCRKCKWFAEFCDEYKQKSHKDGMCEHPKYVQDTIDTVFDYYCADGERRTDEQ